PGLLAAVRGHHDPQPHAPVDPDPGQQAPARRRRVHPERRRLPHEPRRLLREPHLLRRRHVPAGGALNQIEPSAIFSASSGARSTAARIAPLRSSRARARAASSATCALPSRGTAESAAVAASVGAALAPTLRSTSANVTSTRALTVACASAG